MKIEFVHATSAPTASYRGACADASAGETFNEEWPRISPQQLLDLAPDFKQFLAVQEHWLEPHSLAFKDPEQPAKQYTQQDMLLYFKGRATTPVGHHDT
jgi:hypothetical protein